MTEEKDEKKPEEKKEEKPSQKIIWSRPNTRSRSTAGKLNTRSSLARW